MFGVFDGGFPSYGTQKDRETMLAIDAGSVSWGDNTGSSLIDTSQFHEYAVRYVNGRLDVYIDAAYADIVAGTVTSVLSRTSAPYAAPGMIVFGDQTNDPNVDSNYVVDFVRFENLAAPAMAASAIPTLSQWALLGLAAIMGIMGLRHGWQVRR